jgi:hypothetical protein
VAVGPSKSKPTTESSNKPSTKPSIKSQIQLVDTSYWINNKTIFAAICNSQPNKAPGPDGIMGKMLKHLPQKTIS